MRGFSAVVAAWLIGAAPCAAQLSLLGAGPGGAAGGGGGGLGTPFLIGGGTEVGIAAGTAPRSTTSATCPIGGVVMAAVLNTGQNSASLLSGSSGYSDGTNTYSVGATPVVPYGGGTGTQQFALYATPVLTTALSSGASVGPNLSASTFIYQVLVCFPGVTTLDPETPSLTGSIAGSPVTATVPSNSTQPQYAAFAIIGSGQMDTGTTTAPYTDIGLSTGLNTGFGIRFWVASITTTGSSTTLTATISGGGSGIVSASGQRTVK